MNESLKLFVLLGVVSTLVDSTVLQLDPDIQLAARCRQLGFTEALKCPQCELLNKHVSDAVLQNECSECCTEVVSGSGHNSFKSAVLEVCS